MSRKESDQRYTHEECLTLFACLFPKGFAGEDVLAEIAPEGWMDSTLHFVFHPTLDQVHWERVQLQLPIDQCECQQCGEKWVDLVLGIWQRL